LIIAGEEDFMEDPQEASVERQREICGGCESQGGKDIYK
jgi:hypothetical protein